MPVLRQPWLVRIAVVLGHGGLLGVPSGCRSERAATSERGDASSPAVLLSGQFKSGVEATSGQAEIVRRGAQYELRLRTVRVDSPRAVRVYLVAAEGASTTRSVIETEDKFDMAELDRKTDEQIIALPGEPAPELRTVVLWDPAYGVNLGHAALNPVGQPPSSSSGT